MVQKLQNLRNLMKQQGFEAYIIRNFFYQKIKKKFF